MKSTMRWATGADADEVGATMDAAYPNFVQGAMLRLISCHAHAFLSALSPEALAERKQRMVAAMSEFRLALRNDRLVGSTGHRWPSTPSKPPTGYHYFEFKLQYHQMAEQIPIAGVGGVAVNLLHKKEKVKAC